MRTRCGRVCQPGRALPPHIHLLAGEPGETKPPLCTPAGLWPAVTGSPGRQTPPPSELKVNAPPGPAESLCGLGSCDQDGGNIPTILLPLSQIIINLVA